MKRSIPYFIISFLLILSDQFTKVLAKGLDKLGFSYTGMDKSKTYEVIGDIVTFRYVENPGMAFGIEFGAGKIILSLFSIFAAIALAIYLSKLVNVPKLSKIGIMLIFSGAVGNMIDRVFYGVIFNESPLFYGRVVDFIRVDIPDLFGMTHWPVFNIADSCVTVGVVLLLFVHDHLPPVNVIWKKEEENEVIVD